MSVIISDAIEFTRFFKSLNTNHINYHLHIRRKPCIYLNLNHLDRLLRNLILLTLKEIILRLYESLQFDEILPEYGLLLSPMCLLLLQHLSQSLHLSLQLLLHYLQLLVLPAQLSSHQWIQRDEPIPHFLSLIILFIGVQLLLEIDLLLQFIQHLDSLFMLHYYPVYKLRDLHL